MTDQMTSLAEKAAQEKRNKENEKRKQAEEWRKRWIPFSALVVANIIFFSLDIRAFQAIYLITGSTLLAVLTVMISGGLAMYWFDVLYPHSKRHENETQTNLSLLSTILAIVLSAVLAFADYVVGTGTTFSRGWSIALWAAVIILTIWQGVSIAWWWSIDNHITAEARIQKMHAEETDKDEEIESLRMKLKSLRAFLDEYKKLNKDYSPSSVRAVAEMLGISLPDADKDGIPDIVDTVDNRTGKPFKPANGFAQTTPQVQQEREKPNFTQAGKPND